MPQRWKGFLFVERSFEHGAVQEMKERLRSCRAAIAFKPPHASEKSGCAEMLCDVVETVAVPIQFAQYEFDGLNYADGRSGKPDARRCSVHFGQLVGHSELVVHGPADCGEPLVHAPSVLRRGQLVGDFCDGDSQIDAAHRRR